MSPFAKKKKRFVAVDYSARQGDRRRMSHYLRATNFKKIAGTPVVGHSIKRNRVVLIVIFLLIVCVGLYYVFR